MQYRHFTAGPWKKLSKAKKTFVKLLMFWIPNANPHFENKFSKVHYFWLEIDSSGQVCREIGFSQAGVPLTVAPVGKNHGIFSDLGSAPEPLGNPVDPDEFERTFSKVRLSIIA